MAVMSRLARPVVSWLAGSARAHRAFGLAPMCGGVGGRQPVRMAARSELGSAAALSVCRPVRGDGSVSERRRPGAAVRKAPLTGCTVRMGAAGLGAGGQRRPMPGCGKKLWPVMSRR